MTATRPGDGPVQHRMLTLRVDACVEPALTLLRFDHVSKRYPGGQAALQDVSFAVDAGEMLFVTGHSGAGKSTLLRLVHLRERASSGAVVLDGKNLSQARRHAVPALRQRMGVVFQDHRLLADRSVFDNVALPLLIAALPRAEIAKRVRTVLDKVGLLSRERSMPASLSTGEQQRVGIARAVVGQPMVLLADEPTGNLDPQLAADVMELFTTLPARGTTVIIASHDLHLIRRLQKRVLVLDHGRLIDDFRPDVAA